MMLSEEVNEWGVPVQRKKVQIPKPVVQLEEESCFVLEDLLLTLKFLTEIVEPKKLEITSSGEDKPGKWKIVAKVYAGDLLSLVPHAEKMVDTGEMDFREAIVELLDISKMQKEIDASLWKAIKHQGGFTGSSVAITSYPETTESLKAAVFEMEINLWYEKPSVVDFNSMLQNVLKSSMKWWV